MMNGSNMMGYGWMGLGWLFQIAILIIFFLIILWMVKSGGRFGYSTNSKESAEEILKKRLASGEINKEEYNSLKKEIEKK